MRSIFILVLTLFSPLLFGQIEGKGIFCSLEDTSDEMKSVLYDDFNLSGIDIKDIKMSMLFKGGEVYAFLPRIDNDVVSVAEGNGTEEYEVTADKIIIGGDGLLDRKTLVLTQKQMGSLQCEVVDSETEFDKEKERIRFEIQAEYDRLREGNRI